MGTKREVPGRRANASRLAMVISWLAIVAGLAGGCFDERAPVDRLGVAHAPPDVDVEAAEVTEGDSPQPLEADADELARDVQRVAERPHEPSAHNAAPAAALPTSGVLASTFVGGSGVTARLDDLLERGVLVGGQQVRLEALGGRGSLPYPVPADAPVALYADLERTRVDAAGDRVHLQVTLVARRGEAPPRPDLDVRLVIDCSGSMEPHWRQTIAAATAFVARLTPSDRLGIIAYSDEARLAFAPSVVGDGEAARRALATLVPGGGTNIGSALELAAAHRPERRRPNDVALVVLVSDGEATVGQTDAQELSRIARRTFDESGVLTTTIGLGTDFDEATMLGIAREAGGSYHFVRRPADVDEILRDELEARLDTVAQALRVRIALGEGVTLHKVYGSRFLSEEEHAQVRATELATDQRLANELGIASDRDDEAGGLRMHIPSFRRGDEHVIMLEVNVPRGREGSVAGIARVTLDYKDLGGRDNRSETRPVSAERATRASAVASVQRVVKRTVLSMRAGDVMQRAADMLESGERDEALRALDEHRELLEAASDLYRDEALRADALRIRRYRDVVAGAWNGFRAQDRRTLALAMRFFGDERLR